MQSRPRAFAHSFAPTVMFALLATACTAEPAEEGLGDSLVGEDNLATSAAPDRLIDTPFYFSVPKSAVSVAIAREKYPYATVWNPSPEVKEVGLRIIAIPQNGSSPSQKAIARREMATKLAKAGVLQDGDLALTFRPELAGTLAYPHIQMGSTHAGLVYTDGAGAAFNIDSPLDGEYVGQFDTAHYAGNGGTDAGTDALHIVRPRAMTDARRGQLRSWVGLVKTNLPRFRGERQQVMFQGDYLKPIFAATGLTTKQTVTKLGQIILEQDKTTKLPMFCSEFAWHMIALSNCTIDQIKNAPADGATCVDPTFVPMPLAANNSKEIGLAEGPLLDILAAPAEKRADLVARVFKTGNNAGRLSAGHRAVAEQVAPLMAGLSQYYGARAAGASAEQTAEAAGQLNAGIGNITNYSPTAFLVNAMQPANQRKLDYVVTVYFTDATGYAKAKLLSKNPVP
jgi:hypothetical protein